MSDHRLNPNCPRDAEDYERATKYNYSSQEKAALVEIVTMIKDLQTLMKKAEGIFREAINFTTFHELQTFFLSDLCEISGKYKSKKKESVQSALKEVREFCAIWFEFKEVEGDNISKEKNESEAKYEKVWLNFPPTTTQVSNLKELSFQHEN